MIPYHSYDRQSLHSLLLAWLPNDFTTSLRPFIIDYYLAHHCHLIAIAAKFIRFWLHHTTPPLLLLRYHHHYRAMMRMEMNSMMIQWIVGLL
jgi:hypothetical protein